MGRRLRYVPEGGSLVEVTCRTVQGRYLFRPCLEFNEIANGIFAQAQELCGMEVCFVSVLSNHYHALVWATDAQQLSDFMEYVNGHLAREVNRLTGWEGNVFARRYTAILVSSEEAAQQERLRYVLSQGCKEGLVAKLADWPGVHSVHALLGEKPHLGYRFNRTQEYAARRRGEDFDRLRYATAHTLALSQLPCWKHLTASEYKNRIAALVREVEADAAQKRQREGTEPLGADAIQARDPLHRPEKLDRSPAPLFHAASRAARRQLYEGYAWFVAAFRDAAEKLRKGDRAAPFPSGSFPPGLPFVAA